MSLREKLEENPNHPRMVVQMSRGDSGEENFHWGIVGTIPPLTLLGAISRAQTDIASSEYIPDADIGDDNQLCFTVLYDSLEAETTYYLHHDIPADPLLGMLEAIKTLILSNILAKPASSHKPTLFGPDGKPYKF